MLICSCEKELEEKVIYVSEEWRMDDIYKVVGLVGHPLCVVGHHWWVSHPLCLLTTHKVASYGDHCAASIFLTHISSSSPSSSSLYINKGIPECSVN